MTQPENSKNGELPEFPISGPFAGIQSELPTEQIAQIGGFTDALNIMFRQGKARVRPEIQTGVIPNTPLLVRIQDLGGIMAEQLWDAQGDRQTFSYRSGIYPFAWHSITTNGEVGYIDETGRIFTADPGIQENWTGIFDFFDVDGNRIQVATTETQVYYLSPSGWVRLFGVMHGDSTTPMSFAVVGQKLCFSQGVDPVQVWDGKLGQYQTAYVNPVPGNPQAVPAKYLFEFGNHLIACNTISQGSKTYQRYFWTGAGDATDWTSFDSGQNDLFNDLGPITGCLKLFQYGYIFQQFGVVQLTLTGNAAAPFYAQPLSARSKGLVIPRSLAANGESTCYYVGQDNVYMFDGTTSTSVGDMPFQGRVRLGARSAIFQDIMLADPNTVFSFVSTSINGNPYNAYWLVIPNVATWVYNIDDMTWTRWTISSSATSYPTCIGNYLQKQVIRIKDLIGTMAQQQWTAATLTNDNPFTSVMIGFSDGSTGLFDMTGYSEQPWSLTTGEMDYGDPRHENSTKKIRLTYKDAGECQIQLTFTNEDGDTYVNSPTSPSVTVLPGTGSGKAQKAVFPVNLPSKYITMQISGAAGVPFKMTGFAPIYSTGGEIKNEI